MEWDGIIWKEYSQIAKCRNGSWKRIKKKTGKYKCNGYWKGNGKKDGK
jgi:hypothetical protein